MLRSSVRPLLLNSFGLHQDFAARSERKAGTQMGLMAAVYFPP